MGKGRSPHMSPSQSAKFDSFCMNAVARGDAKADAAFGLML